MPHFFFPFLDVGGDLGIDLLAGLAVGVIAPFCKFFVNRAAVVYLFAKAAFEQRTYSLAEHEVRKYDFAAAPYLGVELVGGCVRDFEVGS